MLTDTKIKALKSKNKIYRVADSHGLVLEVKPSGTKYWRYRYRFETKANMIGMGEYPIISLAQARQNRDKYKVLLYQGVNPSTYKKEIKAEKTAKKISEQSTFSKMFFDWYEHNQEFWKPNYRKDIIKRTTKHLLPYIGDTPIESINSKEMLRIFKIIESAGTIDTLYKVKGVASRVFRFCVGLGIIEHDPTRDLPSDIFKKRKVSNYAHISDPKEIGGLLRMIDQYKGTYQVGTALKIAPYVFLRPLELAGLKWSEVDFKDRLIRIDAERMKMGETHLVPLSNQVIKLLENIKNIETGSIYIFPSPTTSKRHISPESLRAGLRRMGLSNDEMTTHGFRHMASTRLYELGFNGDVIERQLAHGERNKIKATYNHAQHLDKRRIMMNEWANYLDKLRDNQILEQVK
jgi:integrase